MHRSNFHGSGFSWLTVNTASVSILFNTACILNKIKVLFIVHFCVGKYSFSLNTFSRQLVF